MLRMARLAICGAAAFLAVGTVRSAGWQQATFKSATALIEVDAVVLDKNGNFVPGLKVEDITLLENGKPQKIQQFFMVTNSLGQTPDALASEHADEAQYGAHRVFVMLFDEAHLANDSLMRVKKGAEGFIRDMIHEGDAGGVFLNGGMYKGRLTVDKGELLAGVRAVQPAFENRQAILAPLMEWPRIPSEVDASRISEGARDVTDALGTKACQEDQQACQGEGGFGNVENLIQQKARLYVRQARMMTQRTIQNLESIARGLAKIPGRKTVVLMSEGFFVEDARSTIESVAAQAARSGITIYSIDGRGLVNGLSPSTYYVIGYQPENATMDGKIRKIDVRANVPGAKVRARKSYAAVALPPQEAIWGFGK
jgi:VWFA-related protein